MAARDRWHQLADAIQASNLPASDKSVFRYLLDRADFGTAELPAKFTPVQAVIARKTSHSRRQVRYAIGHLRRHGWLVTRRPGGGADHRRLAYDLGAGTGCDCTGRVHDQREIAATASVDSGNIDLYVAATDSGNAAVQGTVPTERQREGRVGRKPEREPGPVLCRVCQTLMDPVLPIAGFTTHPCCDPDEVSLLWPPLEETPKGTNHARTSAGEERPLATLSIYGHGQSEDRSERLRKPAQSRARTAPRSLPAR